MERIFGDRRCSNYRGSTVLCITLQYFGLQLQYICLQIFARNFIFCEIAIPRIAAACCGWLNQYMKYSQADLVGEVLWALRSGWARQYNSSMDYLHPVKLTKMGNLKDRSCYCRTYIRQFFISLNIL